ncbi:MAG: hypothetical protein DRR08_25165 [Candidatus Parabeggiatoa sp. nov. 2]|nr:MAG: hypothetical protein B6247_21215 [Beggiatoa sp. 4572_84]RKZ55129.1 MAG: hypothetical protein DRR08_25165 [Gammaproteobacteria bacterium]
MLFQSKAINQPQSISQPGPQTVNSTKPWFFEESRLTKTFIAINLAKNPSFFITILGRLHEKT